MGCRGNIGKQGTIVAGSSATCGGSVGMEKPTGLVFPMSFFEGRKSSVVSTVLSMGCAKKEVSI